MVLEYEKPYKFPPKFKSLIRLSDFAKISLSRKKKPTPKLLNIFGNMCEFYFCSETFQLNKLKLYCKMKCFLSSFILEGWQIVYSGPVEPH